MAFDSLSTPRRQNMQARVHALLLERQGDYPELEKVASSLCISPRTLKRHLHQRGLTFGTLLAQVRREEAMRLLEQTRLSLDAIATRVGYSSAANFSRAFKRWSGVAPGAFRLRLIAGCPSAMPAPGPVDTVSCRPTQLAI